MKIASSLLKHWATVFLGLIVAHGGIIGFNWIANLEASIVAVIPVIINYLNPNYKGYGAGSEDKQ